MTRIVTIGGGSGQYTLLSGLREVPHLDITAIVTAADSGGSSGVLRTERNTLPPGDMRRCLAALATTKNENLRFLFLDEGRFGGDGPLAEHPLLNLVLVYAAEKDRDGMIGALRRVERLFEVQGHVYPVTFSSVDLCAEFENGVMVRGEHLIDTGDHEGTGRITQIWLERRPDGKKDKRVIKPFKMALRAIREAEFIVIGPGDLFTSIIPNVLVPQVSEALGETNATVVFVTSIMTKRGETSGFTAVDFVHTFEQYAGKCVDVVVCNSEMPSLVAIGRYTAEGAVPVEPLAPARKGGTWEGKRVIVGDLLFEEQSGFTRHHSEKLAQVVYRIIHKFV